MKPILLGFTGKMRSGKTTACDYITDNYPNFVRVGFTEALNAEIKQNFGPLLDEMLEVYFHQADMASDGTKYNITLDWLFQNKPPLIRKLQQCYGTEVRRNDDPDYWVKLWKKTVEAHLTEGRSVLCDNVRFLNEEKAVNELGGTVIRIQRSDITDTGTHQSEIEMNQINPSYTILVGPGEQEQLFEAVRNIINETTRTNPEL
jgi:hypothetical protein